MRRRLRCAVRGLEPSLRCVIEAKASWLRHGLDSNECSTKVVFLMMDEGVPTRTGAGQWVLLKSKAEDPPRVNEAQVASNNKGSNPMMERANLFRTVFFSLLGLGVLALASPANAVTCNSVCNQVGRACGVEAKGDKKAGVIQCAEDRDTCKSDCEANALTCEPQCVADASACYTNCDTKCVGSPDPLCVSNCQADECDVAEAQCIDDCVNCEANCDAAAVLCKDNVKTTFKTTKDTCKTLGTTCKDTCIGVNAQCAGDCKLDRRACDGGVKQDARQCKRLCKNADNRRACMKTCLKDYNLALKGCGTAEGACYGGCIMTAP